MHTNTTRATQNATLPRRNRQNPALYQHILSDLAVEADQLKTPVSPTTPTKIRDKNNTKCPIAQLHSRLIQALALLVVKTGEQKDRATRKSDPVEHSTPLTSRRLLGIS